MRPTNEGRHDLEFSDLGRGDDLDRLLGLIGAACLGLAIWGGIALAVRHVAGI
ncbi:hypothetical protein [Salipiger sp.]|uniref:hypothetical protein n=1 Tax=Salipiger sp. TaxID=2078585 RepID=UPI003A97F9B4